MTASRGKVHKYLGMTLDYTTKGLCKVLFLEYLDQIIIDLCVHMAYLTIIHVPEYRLLFPVHHSFGYTGVVWVKIETPCDQGLAKLLVVNQACHHRSIDAIHACQD